MSRTNRPDWLKVRFKAGYDFTGVENLLERLKLNTVCEEAACPNKGECFNRKTATFMILGRVCTRSCTFCNVSGGKTETVNPFEPENIAQAVKELELKHVVITSVTRDDLSDGGAGHFVEVINSIKSKYNDVVIEVLIPDFNGNEDALNTVISAGPDIINHNVETIPSLYDEVRPQADYHQSLELLRRVKNKNKSIYTKSGIMLGLGETQKGVLAVFRDLRDAGCDFLTVGQYLSPSDKHHPVVDWVHPDIFDSYHKAAIDAGFLHASCAPLVRSSYLADEAVKAVKSGKRKS
ncbi:MAG: lipoyl synthase [Spirochaetales bacterium]|uniref:Lipoyl synthase n=1 Tax=Candidatus Thalassospirochaeta sargassi TaxID=3119039 RepID=A0AAJ1IDA5_9SPIO|nr:lipoyl synthase [Spirochaetales bacterium]